MIRYIIYIVYIALGCATLLTQQSLAASPGRYIAELGDCVACHTQSAEQPLAGGKPFPTPLGTIYSTNITPDKEHGIGSYTAEEFIKALRQGVAKDGHHLYPAMPYTAYAKMSDADLRSLFDYLQTDVKPLPVANKASDIPWPLSVRWPLAIWNAMFHDDERFQSVAGKSDEWNRGAYLVQGASHCGSCHTPRGFSMQEKALTESDEHYLSGSELDGWYAPNIRGEKYDEQALIALLKTGRSQHLSVAGTMAEMVTHSGQYFTDGDLKSIAIYLRSLPPVQEEHTTQTVAKISDEGKASYAMYCSTCHGADGKGSDYIIPALTNNPAVLESNPASLLNVILSGAATPATKGHIPYSMPGYSQIMNDQQIAGLLNTVRASWGNKASEIKAGDVKKQRAVQHEKKITP